MVNSLMVFSFSVQSDADYWLLTDADVSITDMWRTERILVFMILPRDFFVSELINRMFKHKFRTLTLQP